jgi:hypothetical protein
VFEDFEDGEEDRCELHDDDARGKPHGWDKPWVNGLEVGGEDGSDPEGCTRKSARSAWNVSREKTQRDIPRDDAQDGLQTPSVSIANVPDSEQLVGSVDPRPKQLPKCRRYPFQRLAALDLALVIRNVSIA